MTQIHGMFDQPYIPYYAENRIQLSRFISEIFKKLSGHLLSGRTVLTLWFELPDAIPRNFILELLLQHTTTTSTPLQWNLLTTYPAHNIYTPTKSMFQSS